MIPKGCDSSVALRYHFSRSGTTTEHASIERKCGSCFLRENTTNKKVRGSMSKETKKKEAAAQRYDSMQHAEHRMFEIGIVPRDASKRVMITDLKKMHGSVGGLVEVPRENCISYLRLGKVDEPGEEMGKHIPLDLAEARRCMIPLTRIQTSPTEQQPHAGLMFRGKRTLNSGGDVVLEEEWRLPPYMDIELNHPDPSCRTTGSKTKLPVKKLTMSRAEAVARFALHEAKKSKGMFSSLILKMPIDVTTNKFEYPTPVDWPEMPADMPSDFHEKNQEAGWKQWKSTYPNWTDEWEDYINEYRGAYEDAMKLYERHFAKIGIVYPYAVEPITHPDGRVYKLGELQRAADEHRDPKPIEYSSDDEFRTLCGQPFYMATVTPDISPQGAHQYTAPPYDSILMEPVSPQCFSGMLSIIKKLRLQRVCPWFMEENIHKCRSESKQAMTFFAKTFVDGVALAKQEVERMDDNSDDEVNDAREAARSLAKLPFAFPWIKQFDLTGQCVLQGGSVSLFPGRVCDLIAGTSALNHAKHLDEADQNIVQVILRKLACSTRKTTRDHTDVSLGRTDEEFMEIEAESRSWKLRHERAEQRIKELQNTVTNLRKPFLSRHFCLPDSSLVEVNDKATLRFAPGSSVVMVSSDPSCEPVVLSSSRTVTFSVLPRQDDLPPRITANDTSP